MIPPSQLTFSLNLSPPAMNGEYHTCLEFIVKSVSLSADLSIIITYPQAAGVAWWSSALTPAREGERSNPKPCIPLPTPGIGASPHFRVLADRFSSIRKNGSAASEKSDTLQKEVAEQPEPGRLKKKSAHHQVTKGNKQWLTTKWAYQTFLIALLYIWLCPLIHKFQHVDKVPIRIQLWDITFCI